MRFTETNAAVGIRQRNPAALEYIMETYSGIVYNLISRIMGGLGNREDREECTSDVFVRVWEDIGRFDPARGSLKTWVLVLAKYQALDARRRLGSLSDAVTLADLGEYPATGSVEQAVLSGEVRQQLLGAISGLEPTDRLIFLRRYLVAEPITSIARDLGLTRQAVDNRLWRGRQKIKEAMETTEGGASGG